MSSGYLNFKSKKRGKILKSIILAVMRKKGEYEQLQKDYEHDALDIIVKKIIKYSLKYKKPIRYRDIKATVIPMFFTREKFEIEKLQVKINKKYFRCKLKYYPYCPNCGNHKINISVGRRHETVSGEWGMQSLVFMGPPIITYNCSCGCKYSDRGSVSFGIFSLVLNEKAQKLALERINKKNKIVCGRIGR